MIIENQKLLCNLILAQSTVFKKEESISLNLQDPPVGIAEGNHFPDPGLILFRMAESLKLKPDQTLFAIFVGLVAFLGGCPEITDRLCNIISLLCIYTGLVASFDIGVKY